MPRIAIPLMLTAFSLMTYHIFRLREERNYAWGAVGEAEARALAAQLELEQQGLAFSASIQREVELEGALLSARTQLDEQQRQNKHVLARFNHACYHVAVRGGNLQREGKPEWAAWLAAAELVSYEYQIATAKARS